LQEELLSRAARVEVADLDSFDPVGVGAVDLEPFEERTKVCTGPELHRTVVTSSVETKKRPVDTDEATSKTVLHVGVADGGESEVHDAKNDLEREAEFEFCRSFLCPATKVVKMHPEESRERRRKRTQSETLPLPGASRLRVRRLRWRRRGEAEEDALVGGGQKGKVETWYAFAGRPCEGDERDDSKRLY
jgi:hypothetical protein